MPRNRLTIIFIIAFLNLVGFGIIIPILPYYAGEFGLNTAMIGVLIAVYPAAQLISAPLLGRLSDRFGRRPLLLISVFINTLAFLVFALAPNAAVLFTSRILGGLAMGNSSVLQAYITDLTEGPERTYCLGRIGAALGLGFIVGPALGGGFSASGYALPALLAALLGLLNVLAIYFWLPESLPDGESRKRAGLWSFRRLANVFQRPLIASLLNTRFFFSLAFSTFTTIFALYAREILHLSSAQTGYILAYAGFLIILVQGLMVEQLVKHFNEGSLLFYSMLLMIVALVGWAFSDSVLTLMLVLVPLSVASGVFRTVITSTLTRASTPEEVGGVLGLSLSADSLTRVIAPSLGGVLLASLGSAWPALSGAFFLLLIVPGAYKRYLKSSDPVFHTHCVKTENCPPMETEI